MFLESEYISHILAFLSSHENYSYTAFENNLWFPYDQFLTFNAQILLFNMEVNITIQVL